MDQKLYAALHIESGGQSHGRANSTECCVFAIGQHVKNAADLFINKQVDGSDAVVCQKPWLGW